MTRLQGRCFVVMIVAVAALTAACGGGGGKSGTQQAGRALVGLFNVTAGTCGPSGVSGTAFRMVQPGGTTAAGPFVPNGDSPCGDKTWTPLSPGRDGGIRTGSYQPQPAAPFDATGNAVSDRITRPQRWFAVAFGLATNEHDPQMGKTTTAPHLVLSGTSLEGDLSSLSATWNGQFFNQGAPKPGGNRPGATTGPRGTYNPTTRAYSLDWTSQIVGGPFNNFTGVWHFEGVFQPA